MKNLISSQAGSEVNKYVSSFVDTADDHTFIVSTTTDFNIQSQDSKSAIVNLAKTNNIRRINKFFEAVNATLEQDGIYIGCGETFHARKQRKKIGRVPLIGSFYFMLEFVFLRMFPKVTGLKKIYFFITKGRGRLLSKAEILGRLVSCGFEIVDHSTINGLLYFVCKKVKQPAFDMNPSYGLLFKMQRIGKHGKMIGVYKFRTMHPYAEYLHDYVLKQNGYAASGKPADDFRLTPWGKFFRKYWIDEMPQIVNVFKGEMKLVGIRPVGRRYFEDITEDLQKLRITQKPGCIPPYVALNRRSDVQSVQDAERHYLIEKIERPHFTDTRYFVNAVYNIVVKKKRSA
jgi:lipopolysaccharide/colanic/teichoic acid biosynthesis glycosyltransferase